MARPKIRHFEGKAYRLRPGETLEQAVARDKLYTLSDEEIIWMGMEIPGPRKLGKWEKPRVGKGSGRAGGARGATHAVDHRRLVHPGTTVHDCPICQYGIKLWRLWNQTVGGPPRIGESSGCGFEPGSWEAYWEGNDGERRGYEEFFDHYESTYEQRIEKEWERKRDNLEDESDFYEQRWDRDSEVITAPRVQGQSTDVVI